MSNLPRILRLTALWQAVTCFAVWGGLSVCALPARAQSGATFQAWGVEDLNQIQSKFWMVSHGHYGESLHEGQIADQTAFLWSICVVLSALTMAARLQPQTYVPLVRQAAVSLEPYWTDTNGIAGYDVLPQSVPLDRYYDDNGGVGLVMVEAYEVTRRQWYLDRAKQILQFVLSGEDDKQGGGIYWHEQDRKNKAANVSAATIVLALRLYQINAKPVYLATARRLYAWCVTRMMDKSGLLMDGIALDGTVDTGRLPSNTATMIRANCLFHQVTHEASYMEEAERIARAAEARWVRPDTGAIDERAPYAHDLPEAFLFLYDEDKDTHWLAVAKKALAFVHDKTRDPSGFYGESWSAAQSGPLEKVSLLNQAAAARAFFKAAQYP